MNLCDRNHVHHTLSSCKECACGFCYSFDEEMVGREYGSTFRHRWSTSALSHTYQQRLGWESNERDKSREGKISECTWIQHLTLVSDISLHESVWPFDPTIRSILNMESRRGEIFGLYYNKQPQEDDQALSSDSDFLLMYVTQTLIARIWICLYSEFK